MISDIPELLSIKILSPGLRPVFISGPTATTSNSGRLTTVASGGIDLGGQVGEDFIEKTEGQLDELPLAQPDFPQIEKLPFGQEDVFNPPPQNPFEQQELESRASPFLGGDKNIYSSEGNRFIGPGDVPENITPDPGSFDVALPPEGDDMKIFISNLLQNQQGQYPEDIQQYVSSLGREVTPQAPQTAPPPVDPRIMQANPNWAKKLLLQDRPK